MEPKLGSWVMGRGTLVHSLGSMNVSPMILKKRSPAVVRIQGRGVAGTVAAKVKHLFRLCKEFEEKVWKWRRFLTDVGCSPMIPKSQDFVDYRIHKTGKMLPHVKFSSKRSDYLRFYLYLCHVIDDFCLS